MMNPKIQEKIIKEIDEIKDEDIKQLLKLIHDFKYSISFSKGPSVLMKHCGVLSEIQAAEIEQIINDSFEKIDYSEW
jgi:uncharacterized protein YjgD (DUF1641 family)